jgi:hypothetical protein
MLRVAAAVGEGAAPRMVKVESNDDEFSGASASAASAGECADAPCTDAHPVCSLSDLVDGIEAASAGECAEAPCTDAHRVCSTLSLSDLVDGIEAALASQSGTHLSKMRVISDLLSAYDITSDDWRRFLFTDAGRNYSKGVHHDAPSHLLAHTSLAHLCCSPQPDRVGWGDVLTDPSVLEPEEV